MSTLRGPPSFCLICYKFLPNCEKSVQTANQIKELIKTVTRFARNREIDVFSNNIGVENLLEFCSKCKVIVKEFTEGYHNLVLLEFRLDFLLEKLVNKISYANKVPVRWINVGSVLEETFPNDFNKKVDSQNRIRKFRQNVLEAGRQRKLLSQPRVFLKRENNLDDLREETVTQTKTELPPNHQNIKIHSSASTFRKGLKTRECSKCGKVLKSYEGLRIHLEHHKDQSEWQWECKFCKKRFSTKQNLLVHYRIHTGEKPFKCRFCGDDYRYRSELTKHLKTNHKNEKGVEKELKRKWALKHHRILFDEEGTFEDQDDFGAEACDEETTEELVDYWSGDHNDILVDPFEDNESEALSGLDNSYNENDTASNIDEGNSASVFGNPEIQIKLENLEDNGLNNDTDDFLLPMENNLISENSSEQNYAPDQAQVFNNAVQRPGTNQCPICGKKLKSAYGLQVHLEYHKDPKDWKWACKTCGKNCATRQNLETHMKTHKNKSNFECHFCGEKYRHKCSLKNHLLAKHPDEDGIEEALRTSKISANEQNEVSPNQNSLLDIEKETDSQSSENHQRRYSLRENRVTSFVSDEIESDDENYEETENLDSGGGGSSSEKSEKESEENMDHETSKNIKISQVESLKSSTETTNKHKKIISGPLSKKLAFSQKANPSKTETPLLSSSKITQKTSEPNILQCEICSRKFAFFLRKELHFKRCHDLSGNRNKGITMKCKRDKCTAYFFTQTQLNEHYKMEHGKNSKQKVKNKNSVTKVKIKKQVRKGNSYGLRKRKSLNLNENESDDDGNFAVDGAKTRKPNTNCKFTGNFECKVCKRKFQTFKKREVHFKTYHDFAKIGGKSNTVKCDIGKCNAYFLDERQLKIHRYWEHYRLDQKKSKKKKHECEICGKNFKVENSLRVHMLYHMGPSGWEWECEVCGKKCATKYKLKEHMTVHTKEKRYECRFCGDRFTVVNKLSRHLKRFHGNEIGGEKQSNLEKNGLDEKKDNILSDEKSNGSYEEIMEENHVNERDLMDKDVKRNGKDSLLIDDKRVDSEKGLNEGDEEIEEKVNGENEKDFPETNNLLARKGDCFGDGTLVEFEDLD